VGLGQFLGTEMTNFSIVRVGKEYVVQADDKSILKVSSRRHAVKLVSVAAELLDSQSTPPLAPEAPEESSIGRDPNVMADPCPDSSEVS
jgi:hypothetical protein